MKPRINALRADYGLAPVDSADEYFRRAPLMLVTTSEPFEYPHADWGDRIRMVGALPWDPPAERPGWLDEIDRPDRAGDHLVGVPGRRATAKGGPSSGPLSTGCATSPSGGRDDAGRGIQGLGTLPANARVLDFVPHRHVLDRTAVAVTHGGMGATQKALARGIPVCVVPFGRDQLEVAARAVHADAGTRVAAKRLTPERLRDAVREAATKREGAARVAAGYAAAGGAPAGADAMEALLTPARR